MTDQGPPDGCTDTIFDPRSPTRLAERRTRNLGSRTDQELIDRLNHALSDGGWVAAKARYLVALRDELADRGLPPPITEDGGIYAFKHGALYEIRGDKVIQTARANGFASREAGDERARRQ